MRSFWTGALSFGLVNIPIRVYSASEEQVLKFDMLHKKDLSPIRYARICKLDGVEVPYSDIVKGFEYEKGEYLVIDEEDFKKANPKKTSSMEILCFTSLDEIDPIYFEKPYFLEPDKKAGKAYNLFCEALKKSKKVAIANFVFHNKEHFGIIKPLDNALLVIQLRYQSEIRSVDNLAIPESVKSSPKELEMALKLIEQLTAPFDPEKYRDTYTEELMSTIEAKLEGKKPAKKSKAARAPKATANLMNLLKQSLQDEISKPEKKPKKEQGRSQGRAKSKILPIKQSKPQRIKK